MGKYSDAVKKGIARGMARTETREIVAERLRTLRTKNNYTQKQIAELTNIDPTTYAGYENKISTPALSALVRLADEYNVSLDYITGRTEDLGGIKAKEEKDSEEIQIIDRMSQIEEELKILKAKIK